MEKISHIVGGSARVGSTDAKNAPPVRPGAPPFGRPIGESPRVERDGLSTAQRVGLIQSDLIEQKRIRADSKMATDMSGQYFTHLGEAQKSEADGSVSTKSKMISDEASVDHELLSRGSGQAEAILNDEEAVKPTPSKYSPRGSYVDVHV